MRRSVDNQLDDTVVDELMRSGLQATSGTFPHPNPRVGAIVLTPDGAVMSITAHEGPGLPHAERLALADLGDVSGHTMVITLEPCDHQGRTPPCTDAIIASGISRVVVGSLDPDDRVRGSGVARLRQAGIEVIESGLSELVEANDPAYFRNRRLGRPFVTLKLAMTLDGQIAASDGTSQWITGPEARRDVHRLRSTHDAVLIGAGTMRADDPELTVRIEGYDGPQPIPVIIKGSTDLPKNARLWESDPIVVEEPGSPLVDIARIIERLDDAEIRSVLVEGGPTIARSFLEADSVDELVIYVGAMLAGGVGLPAIGGTFATIGEATDVEITDVRMVGSDIRITAHVQSGS